jgi:SAM-dependent methyltransferase
MRFRNSVLSNYVGLAPIPLAFERYLEAEIYAGCSFEGPVLDVGCGEGLFAMVVFADQIDTGLDPDPRELSRAAKLGSYKELIQGSGDAICKPDCTYKTVFSNSVLEHIPDLDPVLKEVHRVLDHGGRFYMTVPTDKFDQYSVVCHSLLKLRLNGLAERYRKFFNRFWRHFHCYTPEDWIERVERTGLNVVMAQTYGSKGSCLLNDALVPFSLISYLFKRLINRWSLFPAVRRFVLSPVIRCGSSFLAGKQNVPNGGLLFLECVKP